MDISWRDLGNLQEPGDYPFRGGTINVTFAEIATWKRNPKAQFRLLRLHPVRTAVKYVLGQEVGGKFPAEEAKLLYESGSGDSWWLAEDPVTKGQVVVHRPNSQSGGQVSTIEVGKFLAAGANGPEHQALRQLIEAGNRIASILIAYDIHPSQGQAADKLASAIKSLGVWWHHLETVWIVQSALAPAQITDQLKPYIGSEDQLLVVDISGDKAEWVGVTASGSDWLRASL